MPYAVLGKDKPGSTTLRTELRQAHLEHLERHAAKLLAAGPLLGDDGSAAVGSLIIIDTDDRDEVDAFIAADPYTKGGLFEDVTISPWRKVFMTGNRVA